MLGVFGTVFAVMQFFFSPVFGSLSDRFGRRPVVLLSNFGLGLDYLLMAWAPALGWLFLGRVISGLTASSIPTGDGLHGRRHAARKARRRLRHAHRGLRHRLRARPGVWRHSRQHQPAPAVPGRRLPQPDQRHVRPVRAARIARQRASQPVLLEARQPGRLALMLRGNRCCWGSPAFWCSATWRSNRYRMSTSSIADYRYHWTARSIGLSLGVVGVFTVLYSVGQVRPLQANRRARRPHSASSVEPSATSCRPLQNRHAHALAASQFSTSCL